MAARGWAGTQDCSVSVAVLAQRVQPFGGEALQPDAHSSTSFPPTPAAPTEGTVTEWTPVLGAMLQALWVRLLGVTRSPSPPGWPQIQKSTSRQANK